MLAGSGIKILSSMQIHKIISICIVLVLSLILNLSDFSTAAENELSGQSVLAGFNTKAMSQYKAVQAEVYKYFYAGMHSNNKNLKEAYLSKALAKYMLLLNMCQKDAELFAQLGVIHNKLGHFKLAREYFIRALNIKPQNPFSNYYYAEYLYEQKNFADALDYYNIAYNNGYKGYFEVNSKLGVLYEKLGDIQKAKHYYSIASNLNPEARNLIAKINELENFDYSISD
jgi:tetratricopeptide (TPR) repeat protein